MFFPIHSHGGNLIRYKILYNKSKSPLNTKFKCAIFMCDFANFIETFTVGGTFYFIEYSKEEAFPWKSAMQIDFVTL